MLQLYHLLLQLRSARLFFLVPYGSSPLTPVPISRERAARRVALALDQEDSLAAEKAADDRLLDTKVTISAGSVLECSRQSSRDLEI